MREGMREDLQELSFGVALAPFGLYSQVTEVTAHAQSQAGPAGPAGAGGPTSVGAGPGGAGAQGRRPIPGRQPPVARLEGWLRDAGRLIFLFFNLEIHVFMFF